MKRSRTPKPPLYNYNAIARVTPVNPNFVQLEVTFEKLKTTMDTSYCRKVTIWLPFQDHNSITAFSGFARWQVGSGELVDHPKDGEPKKMLRYIINDDASDPPFDEKEFGFGFKIDKSEYNNLPNLTFFVQEESKGATGDYTEKAIQEVSAGIVDASVNIDYFIALDGKTNNNIDKIKTVFSRGEDIKLVWSGHNIEKYELIINEEKVINYNGKDNSYRIDKDTMPKECLLTNDTTLILKATGDKLGDVTFKTLNITIKDPVMDNLDVSKGNLLVDAFHPKTEEDKKKDLGIFFRKGFGHTSESPYNLSILAVALPPNNAHRDGLSINAHRGIKFCTNSDKMNFRMLIKQDGKVGIGIDPKVPFHVKGDTKIDGNFSIKEHKTELSCGLKEDGTPKSDVLNIINGNFILEKKHRPPPGGGEPGNPLPSWEQSIIFKDEVDRVGVKIAAIRTGWKGAPMKLSFYTGMMQNDNRRNLREHMSIDNQGRVAIGIVPGQYRFQVGGNSRMAGDLHIDGKLWMRPVVKGDDWKQAKNEYYAAIWNEKQDDHALWKKSDFKLKKNIHPLESSLQNIMSLKGKSFDWQTNHLNDLGCRASDSVSAGPNASPEEEKKVKEQVKQETIDKHDIPQIGFIAQDVEKVFPDWVREGDDGMKEVNLSQLNAVIVEALKELKEEKDQEIQKLSKQNQEMMFEMKKMKKQMAILMKMMS